jgi:hypothetical protein
MEERFVLYRGIRMIQGWPGRIQHAQTILSYTIDGVVYPRIPFGREEARRQVDRVPCHDCSVLKGELHVPGCDVEECPRCHEPARSCPCTFEGFNFKFPLRHRRPPP